MPPRMADYGAGWAGVGMEGCGRMTDYGQSIFNKSYAEGRSHVNTGFTDKN